jgi:hypothetical protein
MGVRNSCCKDDILVIIEEYKLLCFVYCFDTKSIMQRNDVVSGYATLR